MGSKISEKHIFKTFVKGWPFGRQLLPHDKKLKSYET